jgi:serine/threonine-protein kinase
MLKSHERTAILSTVHEEYMTMSNHANSPSTGSDRNLLIGILALQMDFVNRDQLIAAMNAWVLDKGRALDQILHEQGVLADSDRLLLKTMVDRQIEKHGGNVHKSLSAIARANGQVAAARPGLEKVADFDVHCSVACMPDGLQSGRDHEEDPELTVAAENGSLDTERFHLLRLHDRGGLGEVYVALDRELNREVALKRITDEQADNREGRARFVVEAEITGNLEHPGIVPVYSLGHDDSGRPYYAMRFIKGDNLRHAADQFHHADAQPGRAPGARALELRRLLSRFLDICNAIDYAHSRGVLHRDIKPSNVMLGKYGETLMVDWGLAKSVGRPDHVASALDSEGTLAPGSGSSLQPTVTGSRMGTPAYMSPEQAAGQLDRLSPASDVYSLGATLYYLLTGKTPFDGSDLVDVLRRVETGEFTAPRLVNPRVDPALESICVKAMAHDPSQRYATARALSVDIEHWLADEPVGAHREPWAVQLRRWGRRHRPLVAGMAGLLVAAVLALAAGTLLLGQANRRVQEQRDEAQHQRDEAQTQRDLARENFERARGAVNTFLTRFSEDRLLKNQPGLQPLRRQLLSQALAYYQDFIKQRAEDPTLQREMAEACRRAGEITGEIGSREEAIRVFEKGISLFEPLLAAAPDDVELRSGLGCSQQMLAYYNLRSEQVDLGERAARTAIALFAPLEAKFPEVSEYGRRLARSYDLLAVVGLETGRNREYEPNWDHASEVLRRTIARHPDDLEAKNQLGVIYSNSGESLEARDDQVGACNNRSRAIDLLRQLLRQEPENPLVRRSLTIGLSNLGRAEANMGQPLLGERHIKEGDAVLKPIVTENPSVTDYWRWRLDLAVAHVAISGIMEQTAQCEAYMQAARRIVARIEQVNPLDKFQRISLADSQASYGEMLAHRQRWIDAQAAFETSLSVRERLVRESPEMWAEAGKLLTVRGALAEVRLRVGRQTPTEALSNLEAGRRDLKALQVKYPYARLRHFHAETLLRIARTQLQAGNTLDALESVNLAITNLETLVKNHAERHNYLLTLARCFALRGDLELRDGRADAAVIDAGRAVELLEPLVAEGSGYLFELGCYQAAYCALVAAHPRAKARRACDPSACLATLKKAIDEGCDNVDALRNDARLAGLRLNPDFNKLIERAEGVAQTAAAALSTEIVPTTNATPAN